MPLATTHYGAGVAIQTQKCRLTAHTAHSKGDVTAVSFADLDSTSLLPYKTKAVADIEEEVIVVAMEDVAQDAEGWYAISGVVDALLDSGVAAGEPIAATASAEDFQDAAALTNVKVVGRALEAGAGVGKVWFDGLHGIGTRSSDT